MATVKALILRTAGTNCDEETGYAFEVCGAKSELVHVNSLVSNGCDLKDYQILAFPGGFTYGDDVASGKVLAVELADALGEEIQAFIDRGGLVIGICNGFQALVKTGLLPYARFRKAREQGFTLTHNDSHKYEDRWVWLEADKNSKCIFVKPGERIYVPVAHGEGKLVARTTEELDELERNGQVAYRYVNENGSEPVYPADPNGSARHIAGICDPTGRVFGLMPHPERHLFNHQHPHWTRKGLAEEGEGMRIFRRAVAYCK